MQTVDEASMQEHLFRLRWLLWASTSLVIIDRSWVLLRWAVSFNLWSHDRVYDWLVDGDNVIKGELLVDAVLRDYLDVVFLFILGEQESEASRANVLPPVLIVEPV